MYAVTFLNRTRSKTVITTEVTVATAPPNPHNNNCSGTRRRPFSFRWRRRSCERRDECLVPRSTYNISPPHTVELVIKAHFRRETTDKDCRPQACPDTFGGWLSDHGKIHLLLVAHSWRIENRMLHRTSRSCGRIRRFRSVYFLACSTCPTNPSANGPWWQ